MSLFHHKFRVVSGVAFVTDKAHQPAQIDGQVGIQFKTRAIIAQVPVLASKNLVRDDGKLYLFALWQVREGQYAAARLVHRLAHEIEGQASLCARQIIATSQCLQPFKYASLAGQHLIEQRMRLFKERLRRPRGANIKAPLYLVFEREGLAVQLAAYRFQRSNLFREIECAMLLEALRRKRVEQGRSRSHKLRRGRFYFTLNSCLPLWRSIIIVHKAALRKFADGFVYTKLKLDVVF